MVSVATDLAPLASRLTGALHTGRTMRSLYATDASEYQEMPLAVALPRSEADVRELVTFAARHRIGLIPRGAGTSLAGQVVGSGIVVDVGRHLNQVVSFDAATRRRDRRPARGRCAHLRRRTARRRGSHERPRR